MATSFEQTRNKVPWGLSKPNMNDFWSVVFIKEDFFKNWPKFAQNYP